MDTRHIENTAEDLIAHKLQRGGLLVAKPKFDQKGADLIALDILEDGAKFCKIQCKGRSLKKRGDRAKLLIPKNYVTYAFILFLYIDTDEDATNIFCFFMMILKNGKQKNILKGMSITLILIEIHLMISYHNIVLLIIP
jgi:hypothetical protein